MGLADGFLSEPSHPPSSSSTAASPLALHNFSRSPLARSASEGESSFRLDSSPPRSFARPPKVPPLPDPSQFPDPYPLRSPHHRISDRISSTLPALSSAGSSSASTRSSAYTSSGSALANDFAQVHVVSGDEDEIGVAVGITSDDVVQMMVGETSASSSAGRAPIDQTRWSEYSASIRSRSSSIGLSNTNSMHESGVPRLRENPSFDMGWQTVDERDEVGLTTDEETDDLCEDEDDTDEKEEERTSAAVVAEEGRGLIVKGEGVPIVQLHAEPGTTHLLVGSSSTPNAVPAFLTNSLPQICHTLLALDISANFLVALPPALSLCENLEELNIASNPLRVLPVFLTHLVSLRVLIADATGIGTLPDSLCELDKLHTLSIRRNKMHSLPSWLCLLPSLQELYLDGNPFQGPWQALVEPLLSKTPLTPLYPPSTPMIPTPSASIHSSSVGPETDTDDSEPASADREENFALAPEDDTITPARSPFGRSATSPMVSTPASSTAERGLTRTRTAPNRSFYAKPRPKTGPVVDATSSAKAPRRTDDSGYYTDHDLRKMKSAGELRASFDRDAPDSPDDSPLSTPSRPGLTHYATSASSSNLLSMVGGSPEADRIVVPKRFASLGVSSITPTRHARPALSGTLWDSVSENPEPHNPPERVGGMDQNVSPPRPAVPRPAQNTPSPADRHSNARLSQAKENKEKAGRWGFLKKMSMGKMRPDSPASRPATAYGRVPRPDPISTSTSSSPIISSASPQIDVRFSTTGTLGPLPSSTPILALSPPVQEEETVPEESNLPISPPPSASLLVPSPLPRSAKRRSFLPVDGSFAGNISIPSPTGFMYGVSVTDEVEDVDELRQRTPSPIPIIDTSGYAIRREEERARESYTRALRSVMAYLKDMNDLGLSQGNTTSMYGSSVDEVASTGLRSRRPTVVENRANSESSVLSLSRAASVSGQLRSPDAMAGLRSGNPSQTISVATTDSSGSSEERKYKDDKGKRALIVREIVETERTYVKGLQELVDIYIKPSSAPVNLISGVGSGKDTVIPAPERKIVFGGIEALFSFHKESFLPALEKAASPLMRKPSEGEELDPDGQLSIDVTKAVASIFLGHAAFMKMYSSYINNFDNSVERVKYWSTDRAATGNSSPGSNMSPSSSHTQLVGLGLSMSSVAIPAPGIHDPTSAASGVPNLSSGQRKRIKTFLKRCRINPRHSQLNMEGYLLLPVQRIPRYRLLLEELLRSTPPSYTFMDDALDRALAEISSLANNMNEGKRESESRRKLVQWQARIRGKFPSPLVQPHRRLIMDGPLLLTRVVRKTVVSFETFTPQGDMSSVQVDCLAPELTPRPLVGVLCNDLLVLCRDPSEGNDPLSYVDLWAVLRMQTLPQPASIVHGNALRLVDNKAILYFDAPTPSDALNWYRAINLHIPSSKS
ncbi:hypothetical protein BJ138DRAFT_1141928 [Hygrophoropsis aurantiaca]|uniref:Uncharacterized protein n=1 Tax=Hygrophoropsis aurantiaca TaxID=72124 RepID=A0ACB8AQ80_9AGAM|nr:hypothetical protein BJ138DRAFT_1141928 [Hygrophoropsis aurantiaca]